MVMIAGNAYFDAEEPPTIVRMAVEEYSQESD
jgi:hypothetical protein